MKKQLSISYLLAFTTLVSLLMFIGFAAGSFDVSGNTKSVTTAVCLNLALTYGCLLVSQLLGLKFLFRWLVVVSISTLFFIAYSVCYTQFHPAADLPINFYSTAGAVIWLSIFFLTGEVVSAALLWLCPSFASAEGVK